MRCQGGCLKGKATKDVLSNGIVRKPGDVLSASCLGSIIANSSVIGTRVLIVRFWMLALTLTGTREPLAFGQQQRDHINDQSVFQARSPYFPALSVLLFFSY